MAAKKPWQESMNDREIAAMFVGFAGGIAALRTGEKLPADELIQKHAATAIQILDGGAFNPMDVIAFSRFMDENFK